eukprot:scaffold1804_cov359-Prasinococcus_capsulatus_cf.AAC.2
MPLFGACSTSAGSSDHYSRLTAGLRGLYLFEGSAVVFHKVINFHDRTQVATSIAVVGCREDRQHIVLMVPVVPFHDQLVRSNYKGQPGKQTKSTGSQDVNHIPHTNHGNQFDVPQARSTHRST